MSKKKFVNVGVFLFDESETAYAWADRTLDAGLSSVSQTMEEDVLEFVHSDVSVKLDDSDGVASSLLMALSPTAKWRLELRRNPASWVTLWAGIVDPQTISQDFADKTVSLTAYSYSKLLDMTSAEDVKRNVTGVTGTTVANGLTVTVSSATDLEIDDEITLSAGANKETRRIVDKNALVLTVAEAWTRAFTNAALTLETPYYRNLSPDALAVKIYNKAGITNVNTRMDSFAISDPFAGRMNSAGLSRRAVDCVSYRGSGNMIAAFENGAAFSAPNPTAGFSSAAYTPVRPSDWRPYTGTEPAAFRDIAQSDNGNVVTGALTPATRYWYGVVDETGGAGTTTLNLRIKDDTGTIANVDSTTFDDTKPTLYEYEWSLEYNQSESRLWFSWELYRVFTGSVPHTRTRTKGGCTAYTTALLASGTRPVVGGSRLRYSYVGPHMIEFGTYSINVIQAATPYAVLITLEHRPNLYSWTMRRIGFDGKNYYACIQRVSSATFGKYEWRLILWDRETGAVVTETKIADGFALGDAYASVWNDTGAGNDIYVGYVELEEVGGLYFYVTKSGASVVEYADFEGKSCAAALKDLAVSTGSVIFVDETKRGYFIGRNSLAAEFGAAPATISDPISKEKKLVWEWYRSSCEVTGRVPTTDSEFKEIAGDTGNKAFRLDVDAAYVSTPGLAKALAQNYVNFLGSTDGQLDVTVDEPATGPAKLFNRVTLDGTNYRVFKVESDYLVAEQALTLVQE